MLACVQGLLHNLQGSAQNENMAQSVGEGGLVAVSILFTTWIGTNFFVELAVNLVLAVAINRIVLLLSRGRKQ